MNEHYFKVILVDDDEDDRFLFKEAFQGLKLNTELALFENGQEFIDYLGTTTDGLPEIVFLDLNMPLINGLECLRHLRKFDKFKDIFVAIYSTSSSEKDMRDTLRHGANIYIQKPNNFTTLTNVIDRALRTCHQYATSELDKHTFLMKLP